MLISKKFLGKKNLESKEFFGKKKIFGKRNIGSRQILAYKYFGYKKFQTWPVWLNLSQLDLKKVMGGEMWLTDTLGSWDAHASERPGNNSTPTGHLIH